MILVDVIATAASLTSKVASLRHVPSPKRPHQLTQMCTSSPKAVTIFVRVATSNSLTVSYHQTRRRELSHRATTLN